MRFYNVTHKHYCGIDLHARNIYTCVLDQEGKTLLIVTCRRFPMSS
jgi:hypothetical protein